MGNLQYIVAVLDLIARGAGWLVVGFMCFVFIYMAILDSLFRNAVFAILAFLGLMGIISSIRGAS